MFDEAFMSYNEWINDEDHMICEWLNDKGFYHRVDGPAYTEYDPKGILLIEEFLVNGVIHRTTGPAIILYHSNDSLTKKEFWVEGKFLGIDKEGFFRLWDQLSEFERNNPEILKCLARFS
jgi:hypothetical protein